MNLNNKLILTIDLDAFFASAEELRHPELKDKPMVVGQELNGRGIIVTANYKARELGIHAGMPLFKARKILPNITLIETDHEYYQTIANEFFNVILEFVDKVQVASIDECHIDATELTKDYKPIEIARMIQNRVINKTGLSTSIGISTNVLLSKVASNFDKPFGISTLYVHEIQDKLWPLPVKEMHMIGAKTSIKLNEIGIEYIGQLALLKNDLEKFNKAKGVIGQNLLKHIDAANGISSDEIQVETDRLRSISRDKTFPISIVDIESLLLNIRELFNFAVFRCEKRKLAPTSVSIALKVDKSFSTFSTSKILKAATIDKNVLWPIVVNAVEKLFKPNASIKFASVSFGGLKPIEKVYVQTTLDGEKTKSKSKLQQIAEKASFMSGIEIVTGSTMEDNIRYEQKEPIMRDNIKFKVWDK